MVTEQSTTPSLAAEIPQDEEHVEFIFIRHFNN